MKTLRTPDAQFDRLPDFPYEPHYTEAGDGDGAILRVHYIDEGPRDAAPILCMHGQPSWSFLYRKMIPHFTAAGYRVLAPDLVGFGRSDKPARSDDYTYARHVGWMRAWLDAVGVEDITLVCQDWGGLIGLRLVAAQPDRFARVVAANTGLPDGRGMPEGGAEMLRAMYESIPVVRAEELGARFAEGPQGFLYWQKFCAESPEFTVGTLMRNSIRGLGDAEASAYEAPFPDDSYMAGARRFPRLVPLTPEDPGAIDNRQAWEVLKRFTKPFHTAFSDRDPVTKGGERAFQKLVPGAKSATHVTIKDGGHFLQDDQGEAFAKAVLRFLAT